MKPRTNGAGRFWGICPRALGEITQLRRTTRMKCRPYQESSATPISVIYVKDSVTVGIGTGEQDRVGVAQIARDKAYRKLADRYCFEAHNIPYNDLKDADKRAAIDARVAEEKGGLIGATMVYTGQRSFKH